MLSIQKAEKEMGFEIFRSYGDSRPSHHHVIHFDEKSDVGKLFASLVKLERLRRLILRGFCFRSMLCLDEIGVRDGVWHLRLDGRLVIGCKILSRTSSTRDDEFVKQKQETNPNVRLGF
ncbi:hypothetical protein SASPL_132364 [Salvia splendens]|uniref:Uncharacterized protein n=1 Tax=Salvia splendens TaxID=180675 RepID=A0A8X8ZHG2_SALSN|nr:hypothetical protein SASPL_132364 [Salvia splendens]